MSNLDPRRPRTLVGVFKEVFNWYPTSYPLEERKSVTSKCGLQGDDTLTIADCCSSSICQFSYLHAYAVSTLSNIHSHGLNNKLQSSQNIWTKATSAMRTHPG